MDSLKELFFSPLGKEYCVYFKYVMYFSFFMLLLSVVNMVSCFFRKGKGKVRYELYIASLAHAGLIYFVNRLMYSICVN